MALAAAGWKDSKGGVVRALSKKRPPENIWPRLHARWRVPPRHTRADGSSLAWSLVTRHHHFPGCHCLVTIFSSLSQMGTCLQEVMMPRELFLVFEGKGERKRERGDRDNKRKWQRRGRREMSEMRHRIEREREKREEDRQR